MDEVQSLDPDMIALTGDLADGTVQDKMQEAAPLAELHPPYGKYYVTGNHEYYWDSAGWTQTVCAYGFIDLNNAHRVLEKRLATTCDCQVSDLTSLAMGTGPRTDLAMAIKGSGFYDQDFAFTSAIGRTRSQAAWLCRAAFRGTHMRDNIFPSRLSSVSCSNERPV